MIKLPDEFFVDNNHKVTKATKRSIHELPVASGTINQASIVQAFVDAQIKQGITEIKFTTMGDKTTAEVAKIEDVEDPIQRIEILVNHAKTIFNEQAQQAIEESERIRNSALQQFEELTKQFEIKHKELLNSLTGED